MGEFDCKYLGVQCFFFWRIASTNSCEGRMRWFRNAFGDSAAPRAGKKIPNLQVNKNLSKSIAQIQTEFDFFQETVSTAMRAVSK